MQGNNKKLVLYTPAFFMPPLGYSKINTHLCIGNKVLDMKNFLIQIVVRW